MTKRRSKRIVSYNMSRIRSKGSEIEKKMSRLLWAAGLRGYRKNYSKVHGKPDFVWNRYKVAVFCDSAFWHGYKNMKTNIHNFRVRKSFWKNKIERNILRDRQVTKELKKDGWRVLRFWDFQIKDNAEGCITKIIKEIKK